MRRIKFDMPRWHVFQHREARGLPRVEKDEEPAPQLEDELFDRLCSGRSEPMSDADEAHPMAAWPTKRHEVAGQLPAFERLSLRSARGTPTRRVRRSRRSWRPCGLTCSRTGPTTCPTRPCARRTIGKGVVEDCIAEFHFRVNSSIRVRSADLVAFLSHGDGSPDPKAPRRR